MFAEVHGEVLAEECGIDLLEEVHTMSGNFKGVNGSLFVLPVEDVVVEELVSFGGDVNTVAGELVSDLRELMPVSCLPLSGRVFLGQETNVDVFSWEFELVHQDVGV